MNITLKLSTDDLRRLEKLVIKDTDTADKHALEGILWDLAKKAGICDEDGNLIAQGPIETFMLYGKDSTMKRFAPVDLTSGTFVVNKIYGSMYTGTKGYVDGIAASLMRRNPDMTFEMRKQA